MAAYTLQYKPKISKRQAKDRICAHAMFGNHGNSFRPSSVEEVQDYFLRKGIDTDKLIQECRNPQNIIPDFENLIRSTWRTNLSGNGSSVSLVDSDGEVINEMKEPGLFIWSNDEAHFEAACTARDRAVIENSYSRLSKSVCLKALQASRHFSTHTRMLGISSILMTN